MLLPRHPGRPVRVHQLCTELGYACDSVRTLACSHVSRTGQFVYVCPFPTPDGCLAAMASLNVSSCFQVPRNTCYYAIIGTLYLLVASAPDSKHKLDIYFDSQCTVSTTFSETQGDFACFNIGGVCAI